MKQLCGWTIKEKLYDLNCKDDIIKDTYGYTRIDEIHLIYYQTKEQNTINTKCVVKFITGYHTNLSCHLNSASVIFTKIKYFV